MAHHSSWGKTSMQLYQAGQLNSENIEPWFEINKLTSIVSMHRVFLLPRNIHHQEMYINIIIFTFYSLHMSYSNLCISQSGLKLCKTQKKQ